MLAAAGVNLWQSWFSCVSHTTEEPVGVSIYESTQQDSESASCQRMIHSRARSGGPEWRHPRPTGAFAHGLKPVRRVPSVPPVTRAWIRTASGWNRWGRTETEPSTGTSTVLACTRRSHSGGKWRGTGRWPLFPCTVNTEITSCWFCLASTRANHVTRPVPALRGRNYYSCPSSLITR